MLFSPPGMKWHTENVDFLKLWVEFLEKNWTKSVNKDMWNQTLEFYIKSMKDENLTFWNENGAWPSVIDDFVVYVREKHGLTVGVAAAAADTMETD
jgi:DCN1-like protein 1/2